MANTHENLTSLFTDIADAIRSKTGGTESIVADAFPEAIEAIETGGVDLTALNCSKVTCGTFAGNFKATHAHGLGVVPKFVCVWVETITSRIPSGTSYPLVASLTYVSAENDVAVLNTVNVWRYSSMNCTTSWKQFETDFETGITDTVVGKKQGIYKADTENFYTDDRFDSGYMTIYNTTCKWVAIG